MSSQQKGFTLIELLTVISIISLCAALGMTSFYVYRSDAAYAVAQRTVEDAGLAFEGALAQPDVVLPAIGSFNQSSQGPINDVNAKEVLPGMMIPRKMKFTFSYDPTCNDGSCEVLSAQAKHCQGKEYTRWIRYGDGLDVHVEHISGSGCS